MWYNNIYYVLILLCNFLGPTFQYNLDLESYNQHYGNSGSMFGFSVVLHRYFNKNWVIVGAPKTHHSFNLTGVERPGAVYRCDLQETNRCILIPFDSKGNQYNDRNEKVDTKSDQWLGATISSGGENGPVVACAPRYVFHTMQPSKVERIEPVGTCFTATKNFTVFTEYSPCRTNFWGYHRQGSCQAGFSAAISKSGNRLFIGAPGSWYWQGQTYSFDVMDRRTIVYATRESYSSDDDSYLGYSMVAGDFDNDGEEDVAVGMPRGAELLGKIAIYKWNMANTLNITGKQIGAYFGYALCTADVDGDKLDDLIIGAPMYAEPNNEGKYDVGRVYIMLQKQNNKFQIVHHRDGLKSRSRFGTAVTNLGDINQDGFGDFAVGAPYDGNHGRGAVYVFHGSRDGPLKKHSQVIYAEDILTSNYPRTFGFSLAGGLDMDGNLYPDLAVGAYDSDTVFVFKARPVAVVEASTQFHLPNKLINLEHKACVSRRDGKKLACTEIESCWRYDGVNLPPALDFDVSWLLDAKNLKNPRMFFIENEGKNLQNSTIRLEYGKKLCRRQMIYVIENIRDKLTPLEVEMRYQLYSNRVKPSIRERRSILTPVIDQNREIIQRDSINIQKNCGPDNICYPDLHLTVKTIDKFLLGSNVPLEVEILITNGGEDAFETSFYMTVPNDLNFRKLQEISTETPISCTTLKDIANYTLKCDIGNPFTSGKVANFKVIMMPSEKAQMTPSYNFYIEANSTNPEREGSQFDNVIKKSINVWVKTDVVIEGTSNPDLAHYSASKYKSLENATSENDLGPHLVHIYNLRNNGPSAFEEAILYIHWPHQTLAGKTLMYVMNKPETSGNIVCDPFPFINVRELEYDISLSSKSYLHSTGAIETSSSSSSGGIRVQQSYGSVSSHGAQSTNRILTEEQKRKFAEEEKTESTGDASLVHSQRAEETSNRKDDKGYSTYHTTSWRSEVGPDGKPVVITTVRNKTFVSDDQGKTRVFEHTTEFYNNLNYDRPMSRYTSHSSKDQEFVAPINYELSPSTASHHGTRFNFNVVEKNELDTSDPVFHNDGARSSQGFVRTHEVHGSGHPYVTHESYNSAISRRPSAQNFESYNYNEDNRRSKRQVLIDNNETIELCRTVKCATFRCVVNNLGKDDGVWIAIRARLVAETLKDLAENVPINISTLAIAQITKLPYIGRPGENIIKSHEIFFKAIPEPIPPIDTVPLWVVVLSACAGAIILLLLVFLLYKCGFFKRNRPVSNHQERQPLNSRNGYHGDEHL
ncbi:integrin alpha-PS2 isoform X2 [Condylostylus longicornis]|uniref:integrin alpha-PS2 isoform X2 n=1 Tax=Condylostylus longicornis TaxID=2530218 RepID=UPI00244E0AEF|nr:integrin alpha-PS2 isoform X2 [Condylostylus longicornis]